MQKEAVFCGLHRQSGEKDKILNWRTNEKTQTFELIKGLS